LKNLVLVNAFLRISIRCRLILIGMWLNYMRFTLENLSPTGPRRVCTEIHGVKPETAVSVKQFLCALHPLRSPPEPNSTFWLNKTHTHTNIDIITD
jgi:hypothetical protein